MAEYLDRDEVALRMGHSWMTINDPVLNDVDTTGLMRTAGDARLFGEITLPGVNANSQHGPASAAYLVADFSEDTTRFAAFKIGRSSDGVMDAESREETELMRDGVRELASPYPRLSKSVCSLASMACVFRGLPYFDGKILAGGAELRVAPDTSRYTSILVPHHLRTANILVAKYIASLKKDGKDAQVTEEMKEVAYNSDSRYVTRMIAANIALSIFDTYDEVDALNASL